MTGNYNKIVLSYELYLLLVIRMCVKSRVARELSVAGTVS